MAGCGTKTPCSTCGAEPYLLWEGEEGGTAKSQRQTKLAAVFRRGVEGREADLMLGGWLKAFSSSSWSLSSFPGLPFPAGLCFQSELLRGLLLQKRAVATTLLSGISEQQRKSNQVSLLVVIATKQTLQRYWKCQAGHTWRAVVTTHPPPCLCAMPHRDILVAGCRISQ